MESRTFDRAVDYYDKTRGLPDEAMARVIDMLLSQLRGKTCLEVGVGTGRFAVPLASAGVDMTGIDLSEPMLRNLMSKTEAHSPAVCIADATLLPFRDAMFDAGLMCHVLHLIPEWRAALAELFRTVGHGVIAHDFGHFGRGSWAEIMAHFLAEAGLSDRHVGANDAEEVDAAARELGAEVRHLDPIRYLRKGTFERVIWELEEGRFSITWSADDAVRREAAARTREWTQRTHGDLGEERDVPLELNWRIYELD
jgi:ubiquinone/menaquinone biosynthesis C-methylase UbiE